MSRPLLVLPLLLAVGGCSTLLAVRGQQELAGQNAVLSGTIAADYEARGPLIVGLVAQGSDGSEYLLDHFVAEKPGPFIFAVAAGRYRLAAFEDADGDGRYHDEPALRLDETGPVTLAPGEQRRGVDLVVKKQGRFPRGSFALEDLAARSPEDQKRVSLFARSVAGNVVTIDDPRFRQAVATDGMWKHYDFILQGQPGIYFLEPYDAKKIPVLFVHGVGGTPQNFTSLIAALDRNRFQPWVYYYPSGSRLETSAALLTQLFVRLREQYDFEKAAVVAHSMGGLVSREFLLRDYETNATRSVRLYATISSPLGGMASAGKGVERSPIVLECWKGLAPGSAFLDGLYYVDAATKKQRRRLPSHLDYHMLFGFRSKDSSDGVVTIASQLRSEAQDEARSLRGFDENHTSILESPAVATHLNTLLATLH